MIGPSSASDGRFGRRLRQSGRPSRDGDAFAGDSLRSMTGRTFLAVEASLSGRRWMHALDNRAEAVALRIAQDHGLPDIVGRVLAARGVSAELAPNFLAP